MVNGLNALWLIAGGGYKYVAHFMETFVIKTMKYLLVCSVGLACILLHLLPPSQSTSYEIIGDERTMNFICDDEDNRGNVPLRKILDTSGLHFVVADDMETLYYTGDIKMLDNLVRGPITMEADVYRWQRSQWLPTGVSLRRDNLCEALKNPREIWYPILTKIGINVNYCPPKKGTSYTLTNVSNHVFVKNMPFADVAGDLKAVVHFGNGGRKTCIVIYLKVYTH